MADAISSAVMATVRRSGCPELGLRLVLNHPRNTASYIHHQPFASLLNDCIAIPVNSIIFIGQYYSS